MSTSRECRPSELRMERLHTTFLRLNSCIWFRAGEFHDGMLEDIEEGVTALKSGLDEVLALARDKK